MSDAAIEAVLRRDRVIVAAAVVVLTALAWAYVWWLAADMDVGGMDMSDFRMIPAGMGLMMPATALDHDRFCVRVRHVGRDDDRHDDAFGRADAPDLCARRPGGGAAGKAIGGERLFCRRLPSDVDRLCSRRNVGAMGAGTGSVAHTDDGGRERYTRRRGADCRWPISVDAAQGRLSAAMPSALVVHSAPRRISSRRARRTRARCSPWQLLHRLLLGADGIALRRRGDERIVDRRDRDSGTGREGHSRWACGFAHRRCRAFRGRRMAPGTSTAMNGKPMSASGTKRTCLPRRSMSAFGAKADMA